MKTEKELNEIKEEVEAVSAKLHELTEDELEEVTAGWKMAPDSDSWIKTFIDALFKIKK